mgnify:CR=1 FL=1
MATERERQEFIAVMVREFPAKPFMQVVADARTILRHARTHGNLACEFCNGPQYANYRNVSGPEYDAWQAQIERRSEVCKRRITEVLRPYGVAARFGGDPRGYTVKIMLPSTASNTWGGKEEGWGVPQ